MEQKKIFPLQFFAEGEGAGAGANEAGGVTAGSENGTGSFRLPDGMKPGRHLRAAMENAAKAETEPAAQTTETEPAKEAEQTKAEKTFTQDEVNAMIQKRVRAEKGAQKALDDQNGKLAGVMEAYGVDTVDALVSAIMGDRNTRRMMAENLGVPEEHLDATLKRRREEKKRDAELLDLRERERQRVQFSKWYEGEVECKKEYPDFDLQKELSDPNTGKAFRAMLGMENEGVSASVKNVYEYIHGTELREQAAKKAAADAVKNYEQTVKARGQRPVESGATGGNAAKVTVQIPPNMTRAQRLQFYSDIAHGKIKPS